MSIEVYYFSGTGNSLAVARDVARKVHAHLISISSVLGNGKINTAAEAIGIIFPVYYSEFGGLPLIIRRFIRMLDDVHSKYIFAVCLHDGKPGKTIKNLADVIRSRGGVLAAGFLVKINIPTSISDKLKHILFHTDMNAVDSTLEYKNKSQMQMNLWKLKLQLIGAWVNARETERIESRGTLLDLLFAPLIPLLQKMHFSRLKKLSKSSKSSNRSFMELIHLADKSFITTNKCNGCGICSRVCPVNNIEMVNNQPLWQHHCENCLACFNWCPQGAIHGEMVSFETQHHHPDVKIADMVRVKSQNRPEVIK